jgi:hypothetical protein
MYPSPIWLKHAVRKIAQNRATSVYNFNKTPKGENSPKGENLPKGENSPNLITLMARGFTWNLVLEVEDSRGVLQAKLESLVLESIL